jgi:hypothetical protein
VRRLGELVRAQRVALGLSVDALAALPIHNGPGSTMVYDLEAGRRMPAKASSISGYEAALGVESGSFARVLGGEEQLRPASRRPGTVTLLDERRPAGDVDGVEIAMAAGDPLRPIVAALAALTPEERARLADVASRWLQRPA